MSFSDHLTLDAFAAHVHKSIDNHMSRSTQEVVMPAVTAHLADLAARGVLQRVTGVKGREVHVADAWNGLLDGRKADFHWAFAQKLAHIPTRVAIRIQFSRDDTDHNAPLTDAEMADAYRQTCDMLDGGDLVISRSFRGITLTGDHVLDDLQDSKTGDRCRIEVTGWKPSLMRLDMDNDYVWVEAGDVDSLPLAAESFDVPSGRLLLSDFVRVDGINEAIKDTEHGIGSDLGQLETTRDLAAIHDMAYAQTDNISVAVFRVLATGAIAIYDRYDRKTGDTIALKGLELLGTFDCDVWRITALDQDVAAKLATEGGNEDGAKAVADHLALADAPDVWTGAEVWKDVCALQSEQCSARNIVRVDVAPGRWMIHCGSDFSKRADRKAFGLPRGGKLWAVLTKDVA